MLNETTNQSHLSNILQLSELQDLSSCVSQKRQQNEVKATNTMIVAFIACLLSYLPLIVHSICINKNFQVNVEWSRFCASLSLFVSSASNPIVYALRTRRFRHALGQLWKDPFGKSPLQEMKEERKPQKKKPSEQQKENCRADSKDGKEEYTMESIDQRGECRMPCSSMEELRQERNAKARAALSERRKKNLKRSSVGISENRRCKSI